MTAPTSPWAALDGRSGPVFVAHRGGSLLAPENTVEVLRLADQLGADAAEMDVYMDADGSLFVMHDTTADRTTNLVGSPATALTTAAALRGRIDAGAWFCNTWPSDLRIPLFSDVLAEVGNRLPLVVHCNNVGSGDLAVAQILRQELGDAVLVMGWGESELLAARAAGIPSCLLAANGVPAGTTYADLLAAGTAHLGVAYNVAPVSAIQAAVDSGLRVLVYDVNSRTVLAGLPAGIWGVFSDDPWYVSGTAPGRIRDLFSAGTFTHGMVGLPDVPDYRGGFTVGSPSWWGLDASSTALASVAANGGYVSVLHGYLGPLGDAFTLDCDVVIDAAAYGTASAQIMLSVGDLPYDDQGGGAANPDGYNLLVRSNGTLDVYSVTGGVTAHLGTLATAAIAAGSVQHLRVTVTAAQLTVARTNIAVPNSLTVSSSAYRGNLYPHFGVRGVRARWANVAVS